MNDLLSELDGIEVDGVSSRKKQDGSSSPLRPNPKYCSTMQSHHLATTGRNVSASGHGFTPNRGARENAQGGPSMSHATSRIPETIKKIMAVALPGAMEIDDDPQTSQRPSSPIRPNEKYCKIVVPSKPPIARVAPLPATRQSFRPADPFFHQGTASRPDDERFDGRRTTYPGSHRNTDLPSLNRAATQYSDSYSSSHQQRNRPPSFNDYHSTVERGSRHSPPHYDRSYPHYASDPIGHPSYARNFNRPHSGYNYLDYGIHLNEDRWKSASSSDRPTTSTIAKARERAVVEWDKQREIEDQKRVQRDEEKRKEVERRKRAETEKARDDDRRRNESERSKASEEKRRHETDRRARAQLKSYAAERPKREEGTVRMTREELEAFKEKCIAEGEQRALAEARKAEAVARLSRCLEKIEARTNEPEPMDVEESDVVESSVPTTSSRLAPMPLIIKTEPLPQDETESKKDGNEKEITVSAEADGKEKERGDQGEAASQEGEVASKDTEDDIVIIEKPPAEVITLSDGEGTVDESPIVDDGPSKEIKQEVPSASNAAEDEELWVIKSKRGRKKNHVFDPSKVKKEKDDSAEKVHEKSDNTHNMPFNTRRVKVEPADGGTTAEIQRKTEMTPKSRHAKVELSSVETRERRNAVAVPARPHRPPSQPLPDYDERDGDAALARPELRLVAEAEGEGTGDMEGADMNAALAAARRLIRQIDETVQSAQQQQSQRRPARQSKQLHQPSPGSFMHSLRTDSRKRNEWCDMDENEEKYLRIEESIERHEWGVKRGRIEEEEEKDDDSRLNKKLSD